MPNVAPLVLAGALSLGATVPASAISVGAGTSILVLDPGSLTLSGSGERVNDDVVSLSLDPRDLSLGVSLERSGRAGQSAFVVGTITNTLNEAVSGFGSLDFTVDLLGEFTSYKEIATGSFFAEVLFGDQSAGAINKGLRLSASCLTLPCQEYEFDSSIDFGRFTIGAGETLPVVVSASVDLTVVAPIPIPAGFFPLAVALGSLAWAGRRRARL